MSKLAKLLLAVLLGVFLLGSTIIVFAQYEPHDRPYATADFDGPGVSVVSYTIQAQYHSPVTGVIGIHNATTKTFSIGVVYTVTTGSYIQHTSVVSGNIELDSNSNVLIPAYSTIGYTEPITIEGYISGDWGAQYVINTIVGESSGVAYPADIVSDLQMDSEVCVGSRITGTYVLTNTDQVRSVVFENPIISLAYSDTFRFISISDDGEKMDFGDGTVVWPVVGVLPGNVITRQFVLEGVKPFYLNKVFQPGLTEIEDGVLYLHPLNQRYISLDIKDCSIRKIYFPLVTK